MGPTSKGRKVAGSKEWMEEGKRRGEETEGKGRGSQTPTIF